MIFKSIYNCPTWSPRSRFEELERMKNRMDRLFGNLDDASCRKAGVFPLANLTEDSDRYFVRAELAGVKSDELDIQVTGNNLSVSGERKISTDDKDVKYHRKEREAGKFRRIVKMPRDIVADKVEAKLADGILTISIPKAQNAKPRKITIT